MPNHDWDTHGRKGTLAHKISGYGTRLEDYLDTGAWALFAFVGCIIAVFVVVCLLCIFGAEYCCPDEYEAAQSGKGKYRRSSRGDEEWGALGGVGKRVGGMQFKTPEELGLLGRGRIVGLGKRD